jgi:hypothetical protein
MFSLGGPELLILLLVVGIPVGVGAFAYFRSWGKEQKYVVSTVARIEVESGGGGEPPIK